MWSLQVVSYKVSGFEARNLAAGLYRMTLASAVMAEVVWAVAQRVGANAGAGAVVRVGVGTLIGAIVYLGMLWVLDAPELDQLRARFSRT